MPRPLDRAVGELFAFPDGDPLFQCIDDEPACIEGLLSMRCGHCDDNARRSDLYTSQSMNDRDVLHLPPIARLLLDLFHFLQRHRLIRFIVEGFDGLPICVIACGSYEDVDRTGSGCGNGTKDFLDIYGCQLQPDHCSVPLNTARQPPLTGGRTATSSPSRNRRPPRTYS